MKIKAESPIKIKFNWGILLKTIILFIISILLWLLLIVSSLIIAIYYFILIFKKGFLDPETIKFSIYIVIGTYFFLILDKEKVYEAFGIKRDIPYITWEYLDEEAKTCQE